MMNYQKKCLTLSVTCAVSITSFAQSLPNILVIITDDQTFESIHALNNAEIRTPNMDRLVKSGTTFTHAYNQGSWSAAVSVASRSMLITGQNTTHAPLNDKYLDKWAQTPHNGKKTEEVTLWTEPFQKAGYETFITGKWHNSDYALLRSFESGKAVGLGFYPSTPADMKKKSPYNRPHPENTWEPTDVTLGGHWTPNVKDILNIDGRHEVTPLYNGKKHTSELYGDAAVEFLQQHDKSRPFFMYVAFNAPHDPRQSPKEFIDMYPRDNIRIPESFIPLHPFDQGDSKVRDEQLAPFPRTEESVQMHRQEYYAILTHADRVIGRILDELEHSGCADNTYVIFTSDHGLALGMNGLMGKQNLYDHTVRVPLILSGPGIQKGKKIDAQVYMQSINPTTCELAGLEIPATVDYKSLVPMLKSSKVKGEEYIYGTYRNLQRMVRSDRYKLIVYPKSKHIQLFDLKKDPYEINNLVENKRQQKRLKQMFEVLLNKQKELEDTLELGKLEDYICE